MWNSLWNKAQSFVFKVTRGEGLATQRETPKEDQTFTSTEIKLSQMPQILPVFWDGFTAIQLTRDWCVTPSIFVYPFEGTTVTVARLGSLGQLPMACASGCEGIWGVRWAPKRLKGTQESEKHHTEDGNARDTIRQPQRSLMNNLTHYRTHRKSRPVT